MFPSIHFIDLDIMFISMIYFQLIFINCEVSLRFIFPIGISITPVMKTIVVLLNCFGSLLKARMSHFPFHSHIFLLLFLSTLTSPQTSIHPFIHRSSWLSPLLVQETLSLHTQYSALIGRKPLPLLYFYNQ